MRAILLALVATAALADPPEPFIPGTGLGAFRRATPKTPCAGASHRQFDFWLGDWKVDNKLGQTIANNHIVTDLDGCVVEEHWAPVGGNRGRSLSSYDAASGGWHQTWVPEGGRPFRLDGGLRPDGAMAMTGVRVPPPPNQDFGWVDAYTWTANNPNQVVQAFTFDIFAAHFHLAGALTYNRAAELPAIAPTPSTRCNAGEESGETRGLDFTLGRYTVRTENGLELARSEIVLEPTLSGCLLEESLTAKGYRATGWLYYDTVENLFYRTVVDNQGNRIELHGPPTPGSFTMTGRDPTAAGALLRLSWVPLPNGDRGQVWERSRDAGATWRPLQALTYARR